MGQLISNILSGLFRVPRFLKADMSGPSAQFVREAIASNKVVIFSKSYCPYCTMAKEVIEHRFYLYLYIKSTKSI